MTKSTNRTRLRTFAAATLAGALGASLFATPAQAEETPSQASWGVELATLDAQKIVVGSAQTALMPDGNWRTWAVLNQSPDSLLVEIDPFAGEVLSSYPLAGAGGSWGTEIAPDGTVWSASHTTGSLYKLPFGAEETERTPRPTPDTSFIWELDIAEDGVVYGGTYEGWAETQPTPAYAFGYDPESEEFQLYGPFSDEDTYIRSAETLGDDLYVGTGSTDPKLYRVDRDSGDFESVPFPTGLDEPCEFVYGIEAVGTDLVVRFNGCEENRNVGYVYDTVGEEWRDYAIPNYYGTVSQPSEAGDVYVVNDHQLHRLDLETGELELEDIGRLFVNKFVTVVPDPETGDETVIAMGVDGDMGHLNLATGESKYFVPEGMTGELGQSIRASGMSPDGKYHVSVGFGGGLGIFDPDTGEWEWHAGLGQGESFAFLDGKAYIGVYPSARIYEYDPSQPWSDTNAREMISLRTEGQDRPFGLVEVEDRLAVGSVAGYGALQGALTLLDPSDDSYVTHRPIEDHGVISLEYRDGVIYGGTTIYGGNGSTPIDDDGRIFAWDVEEEELLWETVAIEGEKGVGSLALSDDGRLFGATVGHVFEIDPATGEVLREAEIDPISSTALSGRWHITDLNWDPTDEHLYMSTSARVYRVDPETFTDVTPEETAGSKVRVAPDGTKYWVVGRTIYSGEVADEPGEPGPDPRESATSFVAPVTLAGRDANAWGTVDGEASVSTQVRLPNGDWSTSQTREPNEDGFYVIPLTYGRDNAGALEWRVRVTYADGTVEFGEPMTQQRVARTTFAVAADTVVGRDANAWGRVDGQATVSTQVRLPNGNWSTSQVRETEADGSYVVPLTYGKHSAGALQWRVHVRHDNGLTETTPVLVQERHLRPSVAHAGAKLVGENTYVWGSVDVDAPTRVFTQVWVDGAWSTSQVGRTNAEGGYTLELTYGKHQGGTYRYRVGADYPGVGVVFSDEFALVRTIR